MKSTFKHCELDLVPTIPTWFLKSQLYFLAIILAFLSIFLSLFRLLACFHPAPTSLTTLSNRTVIRPTLCPNYRSLIFLSLYAERVVN